jgi:pyridoxamine 5'-phosphate oxidase
MTSCARDNIWAPDHLWNLGLDQWPESAWQRLALACTRTGDSFRCPALATLGAGGPQVRTVILRQANIEERKLLFFTDGRSAKAEQLREQARLAWVFYDPAGGFQLRAWGNASLHRDDELARTCRDSCNPENLRNYQTTLAPGTILGAAGGIASGQPVNRTGGAGHFMVVSCQVDRLDVLLLGANAHRRLDMRWSGTSWESVWVSP